MGETTPKQVVDAYFEALRARDFGRVRSYLSNDRFSYRSPISQFDRAGTFVEDISRIGLILEDIVHRKTFCEGNEVCCIVDFKTRMNTLQVTPVVHWATVEHDKIVAIETFFDAREYAQLFDVD